MQGPAHGARRRAAAGVDATYPNGGPTVALVKRWPHYLANPGPERRPVEPTQLRRPRLHYDPRLWCMEDASDAAPVEPLQIQRGRLTHTHLVSRSIMRDQLRPQNHWSEERATGIEPA